MRRIVVHSGTTGVHELLTGAVVKHFSLLMPHEKTRVCAMKNSKFDSFTLRAFYKILRSYIKNLLSTNRYLPYYIFQVDGVWVGRYIASSALSKENSALNRFSFFMHFHIGLIRSSFVLGSALRENGRIQAIFLGDSAYYDGIWIDFYLPKSNVVVYLKDYPDGLTACHKKVVSQLELRHQRASYYEGFSSPNFIEERNMMTPRIDDPRSSIGYFRTDVNDIFDHSSLLKEKSVVVYCHSFSDAQLAHGFSGFRGVADWLEYTVGELSKNFGDFNLIIKPHPNFSARANASTRDLMDGRIWNKIKTKFPNWALIVDGRVSNKALLSALDKNTDVLISHHGNSIVEGAHLGFRSISSVSSPWADRHSFSNVWRDKTEYFKFLQNPHALAPLDDKAKASLYKFIRSEYLRPKGYFSDCHYLKTIEKALGGNFENLEISNSLPENLPPHKKLELLESLRSCVVDD